MQLGASHQVLVGRGSCAGEEATGEKSNAVNRSWLLLMLGLAFFGGYKIFILFSASIMITESNCHLSLMWG